MTDNPNQHNGLLTKIWGPHMWEALHSISHGYPVEPTEQDKLNYMNFFMMLGRVLPCRYCRESYQQFIQENDTTLTFDVLRNRDTITRWVYNLHNRVNRKLDVTYGITYEDFRQRYEACRAVCDPNDTSGCNMPLNLKARSFKIARHKNAPIIPYELCKTFEQMGKDRGIDFSNLDKYRNNMTNKTGKIWQDRDNECINIINQMRDNSIKATKEDGSPTNEELKLISRMSSAQCIKDLTTYAQTHLNYTPTVGFAPTAISTTGGSYTVYKLNTKALKRASNR